MDKERAAYEGYAAFTGGKTFDGRDMPKWDDLSTRTRNAWRCAVLAADLHEKEIEVSSIKQALEWSKKWER